MNDLETNCLHLPKKKNNCQPVLYVSYVDDTVMVIHKDHVDLVVNTFNSFNENLKFTYEIEVDDQINILDMNLLHTNNQIITNWFQKPLVTNRLFNYFSSHPTQEKKNIV